MSDKLQFVAVVSTVVVDKLKGAPIKLTRILSSPKPAQRVEA